MNSKFYSRDALVVAKDLLGKKIFTKINGRLTGGIIVETEAYCGIEDKACHAYAGRRTKRTETIYGAPGQTYIYLTYGLHHMVNIVVHSEGQPHAVLIRAIEPIEGIEEMKKRRKTKINLTNGPGKLAQALGLTKEHNAQKLGQLVWIENGKRVKENDTVISKRIGIDYAGDHALLPYRFYIKGNEFVSRK